MAKTYPIISVAAGGADRAFFLREGHKSYIRWKDGALVETALAASTAYWRATPLAPSFVNWCWITDPEPALVTVSWPGRYSVAGITGELRLAGKLWERCTPAPRDRRTGDVVRVVVLAGKAHALVHDGGLFRLDELSRWTRIDEGLPRDFAIRGLAGRPDDLYAVGRRACWRWNGRRWAAVDVPGAPRLNAAAWADGALYAVGDGGVCLRYARGRWTAIECKDDDGGDEDLWSLAVFRGVIYAASMARLYQIRGGARQRVAGAKASSAYHLVATDKLLWSAGEHDIVRFDGKTWKRLAWFDGKRWVGLKPDPS